MTTQRTVVKLLRETFKGLQKKGATIWPTAYDLWDSWGCGEVVLGEAMVSLEKAAQKVSGEKRIRLDQFEDRLPDLLGALFLEATEQCEQRGKKR